MEKVALNIESLAEDTKTRKGGLKSFVRSPKVFFENDKNQVLALYQTVLPSGQTTEDENDLPSFNITEFLNSPSKLGVVMLSGGHFAAGVFQGKLQHG